MALKKERGCLIIKQISISKRQLIAFIIMIPIWKITLCSCYKLFLPDLDFVDVS